MSHIISRIYRFQFIECINFNNILIIAFSNLDLVVFFFKNKWNLFPIAFFSARTPLPD